MHRSQRLFLFVDFNLASDFALSSRGGGFSLAIFLNSRRCRAFGCHGLLRSLLFFFLGHFDFVCVIFK